MSTPGEIPVADAGVAAPDRELQSEAVQTQRLRRLLEKYELLVALTQSPPGRTLERRDEMRTIAERFPAALREWDQQPPDEIERRRQRVAAELRRREAAAGAAAGGEKSAYPDREPPSAVHAATQEGWLRYGLDLHDCLRAVLQLRRHLHRAGGSSARSAAVPVAGDPEPSLLNSSQRVVHDCGVPWLTVTPELLRAVAQPAQGRLAAIAYAEVARHHKSSAAAIKAAIFGPSTDREPGPAPESELAAAAGSTAGPA